MALNFVRRMRRSLKIVSAATGSVVAVGALTVAFGGASWRRQTAKTVAALFERGRDSIAASNASPNFDVFSHAALADVPAPVARYLAFAVSEGQRRIRTARIEWTGEFQRSPHAGWTTFTAVQHYTTSPPGFVWDATIRMLPLIPMRVRDSYLAGAGSMTGRLGGVAPIIDETGTPELASGALTRWLGEAAWFPTALLPGNGVRWEAINDTIARGVIEDGGNRVQAEFHFAPSGELTAMTAMRYRDVNGTGVLTPFEGRYGRYERREGVMVPMTAEVSWILPEGRYPYWRGRPVAVHYETVK
jgi:hypothetical protein